MTGTKSKPTRSKEVQTPPDNGDIRCRAVFDERGRVAGRLAAVLPWIPVLSSVFFLFRFVPAYRASLLLVALAVHEGGHLLAFYLLGEGVPGFSPVAGGFRFFAPAALSYRSECLVSLAGPLANLIPGACLFLFASVSPYFTEAGWIFLSTGLSNLIPISDHDGGRALFCLLSSRFSPARAEAIASFASLFSLALSLTVALALLYAFGGGFYFTVFLLFSLLSHPLPENNFF